MVVTQATKQQKEKLAKAKEAKARQQLLTKTSAKTILSTDSDPNECCQWDGFVEYVDSSDSEDEAGIVLDDGDENEDEWTDEETEFMEYIPPSAAGSLVHELAGMDEGSSDESSGDKYEEDAFKIMTASAQELDKKQWRRVGSLERHMMENLSGQSDEKSSKHNRKLSLRPRADSRECLFQMTVCIYSQYDQ